jgi:hypothetical protein
MLSSEQLHTRVDFQQPMQLAQKAQALFELQAVARRSWGRAGGAGSVLQAFRSAKQPSTAPSTNTPGTDDAKPDTDIGNGLDAAHRVQGSNWIMARMSGKQAESCKALQSSHAGQQWRAGSPLPTFRQKARSACVPEEPMNAGSTAGSTAHVLLCSIACVELHMFARLWYEVTTMLQTGTVSCTHTTYATCC